MAALQDVVHIYHHCGGLIISNDRGHLICQDCGFPVGFVDPPILDQLIDNIQQGAVIHTERTDPDT
jgi:hypothetical protein